MTSPVGKGSVGNAQVASEVGTSTGNPAQITSSHRSFFAHDTIAVSVIRFNADYIFVANVDGTIGVYNIETGQLRTRLIGHTRGVSTLQCTRHTLFSGSSDSTIRIWDLTTMKLRHILRDRRATIRTMHILDSDLNEVDQESEPENQVIVTGSGDSNIRVWRVSEEDANAQSSASKADLATDFLYDPANHDSRTIESTGDRNLIHTCRGHSAAIRATVVHGGKCVSGSEDKTVRVWDIRTGQCEQVLAGHTDLISSVAYDHDRQIALSGSGALDGTIRVWDVQNGTCLAILPDHDTHITHLRFDRDTFLSTANGSVKVWDVKTHTLRLSMSISLYIISLTVDGRGRVMTAGGGVARIWNPITGITIWETDIGRPVVKVEWKEDRLVVLSMVQGPKSQAPQIDVYNLTWN